MTTKAGIEACWAWRVLSSRADGRLEDPGTDYGGLLEGMDAVELLALAEQVQERLKAMGIEDVPPGDGLVFHRNVEPRHLFIDREYGIHLDRKDGMVLSLRPLVKAVFILFLKHPEGILLKERDLYEEELNEIYAVIAPNVAMEDREGRIRRLVNPMDNSFSEKASVLNARLEKVLPAGTAGHYKIQGTNGFPRRIPLDPLLVSWE